MKIAKGDCILIPFGRVLSLKNQSRHNHLAGSDGGIQQ